MRICVCECVYPLHGVDEDVGDLLAVGQVVDRMPPAVEMLHVGRAAEVDVRSDRRGNLCLCKQTNKMESALINTPLLGEKVIYWETAC